MSILLASLCAITSNLDTLGVSLAYGIKGIKISFSSELIISLISTAGTFFSMLFGLLICKFVNDRVINAVGAIVLILIGFYFIVDAIIKIKSNGQNLLITPEVCDTDFSGKIDAKESVALALALTVNNIGVGMATSVAGISIWLTSLFTFIFTFIAIKAGYLVGNSRFSKYFGKYAPVVSGLIILCIGVYEII